MIRLAGRKYIGFENALRRQAGAFDGEVQLEFLEVEDLYERMVTKEVARTDHFDVMMVPGDFYPTMIDRSLLRPIDELIRKAPPEDWPRTWPESLMAYQRGPSGAIHGLPYHDGPEMLIYRTDLFERHGCEPPATWDAFLNTARKLNNPDAGVHGCVIAAFPDAHNICYDLFLQIWTRGGEVLDSAGRPLFQESPGVDGLQFLIDLIHEHRVAPADCIEVDSVAAGELFVQGKVAMMVNWMGFASFAADHESSGVRGKVATAPVPAGPAPTGRSMSLNNYWCLAITAGSAQAEEAWRFLRHCASAEMDLVTAQEGCIGCRRSSWQWAIERKIAGYELMEPLQVTARILPAVPWYGPMSEILSEELARAYRREVSAAQALRAAAERVGILQ